jgi:DNA invertase Pin-like site-specific DNA recombinase
MTVYGYARVSTDGQSLNAQRDALSEAGCGKIFREKESVAITGRKELTKAIAALDAGDVLVVTRFDRLARSTRDLLNTLHTIAERKAGFKSLADTWADTTTPHGKLILTMLGGLAEFERSLIIARTFAGRATAKANGTKFGRKPKLTPHQVKEIIRRIDAGESQAAMARRFNVNQATISRLVNRP